MVKIKRFFEFFYENLVLGSVLRGIKEGEVSPIFFTTDTPRGFHVETMWKRSFPRCFIVESTWCVCRVGFTKDFL